MTKLKVVSLNCRGMALKSKCTDLFKKCLEDMFDIILLQDTHWSPETLLQVRNEWDNKILSTAFSSNSRGAAILLNNSFEFTIGKTVKDKLGNYVLTELMLPNETSIVFGSVYRPNTDNVDFYQKLDNKISEFDNPNIIIGDNWNTTRQFHLDNNNYLTQNNMKNI